MSGPNESGPQQPSEGSGGTGTGDPDGGRRSSGPQPGGGRITHTDEAAPWQRGTPPPRQPPQRAPEGHDSRQAGRPANAEARRNRFASGSQPAADADAAVHEGRRIEAHESELPDLSGSGRRQGPNKPSTDRGHDMMSTPHADRGAEPRNVQAPNRLRGPVRASMQIRRIDPWSALKVSLILSVALFFVWMIAVALLYLVLGSMGVWSKLNSNVGDLLADASVGGGGELVSSGSIFGGATLIGLVNVVVFTGMVTVGVLIYNVATDLLGGVEVTLADRD